jgi:hypothetical protein
MCGPVTVNLKVFVASALARAQASGRSRLPWPIGPTTVPGGRARNFMPLLLR